MQQVRARIHDDTQSLHGIMPLWRIDHWVPLGDLFVDVNILESLSSSRRSKLDNLWQDFAKGNSNYRSLDRIGLGSQQQRISGLAVLERNTNLMVVGKPGSGKTTYLQRIVTECNVGKLQAHRIPVLIKLRYFVDDGRQFAYNLEQFLGQLWQLSNTDVQLLLNQGRALVLLDGLDEVTGEAGKQISKKIKQFARVYPQVQIVVTCRTQTLSDLFDWQSLRFTCIEVASFEDEQVRAFATHWFKTVCGDMGEKQAREFLEQLFREENKPIKELATTPILLSLTCLVFQGKEKFYSKRSELYEEGLELLLEGWDESKEVERDEIYRDLSVERKLELLSFLAMKKFEQQQYVLFEQKELEGYIGEFLKIERRESRGVLQAIEAQHGLLIERAQKVWSFSHLTFQEYFAARWFCNENNYQMLAFYISKANYREIFIITTELSSNREQLLKTTKKYIDYKLGADEELQNFLKRVYAKSKDINVPYHPAKVRALYFSINRNDILDLKPTTISQVENHFDFNLNTIINYKHAFDCVLDLELAIFLYNAYCIASKPPMLDAFSYHHVHQQFIQGYEKLVTYNIETEFKIELDQIKKILPSFSFDHWEKYRNWGLTEGIAWANQLRHLIVKYRNIRHSLHFLKDEQWELLKKYYEANILLIDCLNMGCIVDGEVRREIEETLLLPIVEIEKLR